MESKGSMLKLSLCHLLLSFSVSSAGSFVVNVTQSWYHAEENHNISLEWMFPTSTDPSPNVLHVSCEMLAPERPFVLFNLHKGVEAPEDQDKRFAGRVQWDKDVLREGRLRLHISRLQTNDSGLYGCQVLTSYGRNYKECHLNVTAVKDRPEPETSSDTSLRGDPRGWIVLYCALGLTAALLVIYSFYLYITKRIRDQYNKQYIKTTIKVIDPLNVSHRNSLSCSDGSPAETHLDLWMSPVCLMDQQQHEGISESTETLVTQGAQLVNAEPSLFV